MPARSNACFAVILALVSTCAQAQDGFPNRSLRMVVPFAAGGVTDIVARSIAPKLGEALGQAVVVDNRGGAGGTIGADMVAKAAPDGYTLVVATISTHAVGPSVFRNLSYDPLRDFAPVSQVATTPNVIATGASQPMRNMAELVALAKTQPGALSYGSSGAGSWNHLAGEVLNRAAGVDIVHVPYKGIAAGYPDLLSGRIHFIFDSLLPLSSYVKNGQMRLLAVTDAKRTAFAPEVPTVIEAGFAGYEFSQWIGVLAPAKTPPAVIARLHAEIAKVVRQPDVQAALAARGAEVIGNSPAEFERSIRADLARYGKAAKDAGVSIEIR